MEDNLHFLCRRYPTIPFKDWKHRHKASQGHSSNVFPRIRWGRNFLAAVLLLVASAANAQIYVDQNYDGPQNGTQSNPYKTISQAAATVVPGTTVYVRAGVYREEVIPATSGTAGAPITFEAYNGEDVTINGTIAVTGWQAASGLANTYVADVNTSFVSKIGQNEQVFVDGQMIHLARYPNFENLANVSYPPKLTTDRLIGFPVKTSEQEVHGDVIYEVTFEDDALNGLSTNFTGSWIWLNDHGFNWANDVKSYDENGNEVFSDPFFEGRAYKIKSHSGNRITFYSAKNVAAASNMQYFLFDKKEAIDSNGEWWLDKSVTPNKLYVRTPTGDDPSNHLVEFKVRDYAFNLDPGNFAGAAFPDLHNHPEIGESIRGNIIAADSGRSYITIRGFKIFGASITTDKSSAYGGQTAVEYPWRDANAHGMAKSTRVILDELQFKYPNHFVSQREGHQYVWGQTGAITLSGTNHVIQNSSVEYTAGVGVVVIGQGHRVFNNTIHDVGYAGTQAGFVSPGNVNAGVDLEIAYNTMYNASQHGVNLNFFKNSNPGSRVARVHHNRISNFGIQALADVGGIYTGFIDQQNTRFDHNIIYTDNSRPIGAAIYMDFGKGYIIDHNILYDVGLPVKYNVQAGEDRYLLYNNTLIANGGEVFGGIGGSDGSGLVIRNNIGNKGISSRPNMVKDHNLEFAPDSIFVDPAGRNYQLASPTKSINAIDKGVSVEPYNDATAGSAPDLGAYEFGMPAPTIGKIGPYTPVLTRVRINPSESKIPTNATQQFSATALDQFDAEIENPSQPAWSVEGSGSITQNGFYSAPAFDVVDSVKATIDNVAGSAGVTVQNIFIDVTGETTSNGVNFTDASSLSGSDWVHFGNGGVNGTDRKASGGNQLSGYTTLGMFQPNAFSPSNTFGFTNRPIWWNDGSPTSIADADSVTKGGVYVNSGVGGGFSVSAPSSTSMRTLTLYVSGYKMVGAVTIRLEDNNTSTVIYTDTMNTKVWGTPEEIVGKVRMIPQFDRKITVKYKTPSKARIVVSWTMGQAEAGGGWASISGATLSFSDTNRVATTIRVLPDTANVELGLSRQFAAQVLDQDDAPLKNQPALTWSVSGGGTISSSGLFTAGNTVGGPFTVTASTGSISGNTIVNVTDNAAKFKFTSTPPTIDDAIDVAWSAAASFNISNLVDQTAPSGPADYSGSFKGLYDNNNLYLLYQVKDDSLVGDDNNALWGDDGTEIFIDRGNKKSTSYQADDFQFIFRADSVKFNEFKHGATSGVAYTATRVPGGYVLEIKVPWATLGGKPTNGLLGFDTDVNDDDDGGYIESRMMWFNKRNTSYFDPSALGVAKLDSSSGPVSNNGLKASYFNNKALGGSPVLNRIDENVNFDWGNGSPAAGVNSDNFSVRWTGQVEAPVTGSYTFSTVSDDGIRLWVNNTLLVDNWTDHPPTTNDGISIVLTEGTKYDIRAEYYENGGGAVAKLLWSYNGQPTIAIPSARLFTTTSSSANIALNKPTTVSGTCVPAEDGSKAVNGSVSQGGGDKWCHSSSENKWLQVDLGNIYSITRWVVKHAGAGGENGQWNTRDFKLQSSVDGISGWADIDVVEGNTENVTDRTVNAFTAQFVRLYVTNSGLDNAARIYEFEVYGTPSSNARNGFETATESTVEVYPVPANAYVDLSFYTEKAQSAKIVLSDALSKGLNEHKVEAKKGLNTARLNVSGLTSGIYFISIHADNQRRVHRIMIKH